MQQWPGVFFQQAKQPRQAEIFNEATSSIPNMDSKEANMAGSKETKLQDTAMKATEKIVTGAVDKAAQTVQNNSQKEN